MGGPTRIYYEEIAQLTNERALSVSSSVRFSNQKTILILFGIENWHPYSGFFSNGTVAVWFANEGDERYHNTIGESQERILEKYDHSEEYKTRTNTNRFAFLKEKETGMYRFIGEYELDDIFTKESEESLALWKRIGTMAIVTLPEKTLSRY